MTQTCEIKTRLTLLTKSFCSRMGIQTTPLDAALRLSDAEVVKDLYQLWLEAGNEGTLDDFLLTFKGDQGDSNYQLWLDDGNEGTVEDFFATLHGKDIELRQSETHIQWKYVHDEIWNDLISVETLKGDEIQLQVSETHIQWKYDNEVEWNDLIALADLTGEQGIPGYNLEYTWDGTSLGVKREDEIDYTYVDLKGETGDQGLQGKEVLFQTSATHIQWKYDSDETWNDLIALSSITGDQGIQGEAGREVEIRNDNTYIQWKYTDDTTWKNIVLLESLRGLQGIQGIQGPAGREVQLQIGSGYIQWKYSTATTWTNLIAVAALKGADGEAIQIRNSGTYIQWKYVSDVDWTNIVAISSLVGPAGEDGDEVQLQVANAHIQWKYASSPTWINLVALSVLKGDTGEPGLDGEDGADGAKILLQVTETAIQWKYDYNESWTDLILLVDLKGADGSDGSDGEAIQLQATETYIQYKYESDVEWTNLLALADLKGDTGETGADGEEIELQNNGTHIQWKYVSDVEWIDLVDISVLQGSQGDPGEKVELRVDSDFIEYKYESDIEWTQLFDLSQLQGADGLSAYEIWINNGGFGTEVDFLISLVGFKYRADEWLETAQYTIGEVINIDGNSYACKSDHIGASDNKPETGAFWDSYWFLMAKGGLSAYEIWLNNGGVGTEQDFLDSLQGSDGAGVPIGGTTGQVLKKNSNTDYDTVWADESGGGGVEYIDTNLLSGTGTTVEDPLTFAAPSDGDVYGVQDGEFVSISKEFAEVDAVLEAITDGESSLRGLSAYEVWLAEGNIGTEADFLNDLKVIATFAIDSNHFFADDTERDAYFGTNPDELVSGLIIKNDNDAATSGYEMYNGTAWIDIETMIGMDGIDALTAIIDDIIDGDITIANMIPAGGTTGQVLVKKSDADFDVEWSGLNKIVFSETETGPYGVAATRSSAGTSYITQAAGLSFLAPFKITKVLWEVTAGTIELEIDGVSYGSKTATATEELEWDVDLIVHGVHYFKITRTSGGAVRDSNNANVITLFNLENPFTLPHFEIVDGNISNNYYCPVKVIGYKSSIEN